MTSSTSRIPTSPWRRPAAWLSAWAVAGFLAAGGAAATDLEAQMYVVTDWLAECPANDLSHWDNMVDYWYDEIDDHGWFHRNRRFVNGEYNRNLLCDSDTGLAGCDDGANLDAGDAVMLGLHGGDSGDHWRGSLRRNSGGGDCFIDAPDAGGGELFAGDVDLEFLHFSSCNSMDDDNLGNTWRMFEDPVDSPTNGRRLHQADGFHGFMFIGSCCDDQYEDFASDAFSVSIKDAWLDNMYVTGIDCFLGLFGTCATQCPVAYAVGTDAADCFNRIDNERYNAPFADPGPIGTYCYSYYDGCNPEGEGAFGTKD